MLPKLMLLPLITLGGFCTTYFVNIVVPLRKPLQYSLLVIVLQDILWLVNNCLLPEPSAFLNVVISPLFFWVLLFYTEPSQRYRGFLTQAVLAVLPILIVYVLASLILPWAESMGMDPREFSDNDGKYYGIMTLLVHIISCLAIFGAAHLLKRILTPVSEGRALLWFLPIPLSQVLLVVLFVNLTFSRSGFKGVSICIFLGFLLSIISDLSCIYGYRKYQKMGQMKQKLKEAEHQLELQAEHYRSLQDDILNINKIRHDLKNQLQAAYYLLEQGHAQEVRQQLDLLNDQISQKVGSRFSENLMVDAVLTEKKQECRKNGITLEVSTLVPQETSVENAYLCSAFSNLLDNSIRAVLASDTPHGPVQLMADIQGEYLVIRCSNPAREPEKRKNTDILRQHGLGLEILNQIAKLGQGDFRTNYENGVFTAVLVLRK